MPDPDVPLSLGNPTPAPRPDAVAETNGPAAVDKDIRTGLDRVAPHGWERLGGIVAMAADARTARIVAERGDAAVQVAPDAALWESLARHRELTRAPGRGPWLRLSFGGRDGVVTDLVPDHGDEPFDTTFVFLPEVYREECNRDPSVRLPWWLAAHAFHADRQLRSAESAADAARADHAAGVTPTPVDVLDHLNTVWARWAALSAAFVVMTDPWGPRMRPANAVFQGASHGGSTLARLPGRRAVLSGGIAADPRLLATHLDDAPASEPYRGAPAWVTDAVLNPRAGSGLLSFCFWFDGDRWWRGDAPAPADYAPALPAVWSDDTATSVIAQLTGQPEAAVEFVGSCVAGTATRATLQALNPGADTAVMDRAVYQLDMAGCLAP